MSAESIAILSALPAFLVRDVRASAEFYRDAFGFRLCWVLGDGPGVYSIVDLDEGHGIHLKSADGASGRKNRARGGRALDAYIRVADVDRAHALASSGGVEGLSAPVDRAWGMREFEALDRDGHALCFGQDTTGATPSLAPRTSPEFLVRDIDATLRFYREVLGFEHEEAWGEPPSHAIAWRGGACFHFARADDLASIRSNYDEAELWDVYVEVKGVDALEAQLRARGAHILRAPETQEYCMREMDVQDPNGYVICFGEAIGT